MTDRPVTREVFVELVEFVENLLGPSRLQKLLSKYERAIQHGNKNYVPHRLIHNYRAVRNSLDTLLSTPPSGDLIAMMELTTFRMFIEKFHSDPMWPEIESDLYSTGSFVHMMSLFLFVDMESARGNNIELLSVQEDGMKTADAVIYTPAGDRLDVEVKAPEMLWAPSELTATQAKKVIENAWRRSKHQIRNGPSVLLIGGIFVPKRYLALLEEAAKEFLQRKKNQHVAYIKINSMTILVDNPIYNNHGTLGIGPNTTVSPQVAMHSAKNPYYRGIVEFYERDRDIPGYTKSKESSEFTIKPSDYSKT